jgi:hypothetical protein
MFYRIKNLINLFVSIYLKYFKTTVLLCIGRNLYMLLHTKCIIITRVAYLLIMPGWLKLYLWSKRVYTKGLLFIEKKLLDNHIFLERSPDIWNSVDCVTCISNISLHIFDFYTFKCVNKQSGCAAKIMSRYLGDTLDNVPYSCHLNHKAIAPIQK